MNKLTRLAVEAEQESYHEGAEAGYWRGYSDGANDSRRFITGETTENPQAPEEFRPLGDRYYPSSFVEERRAR